MWKLNTKFICKDLAWCGIRTGVHRIEFAVGKKTATWYPGYKTYIYYLCWFEILKSNFVYFSREDYLTLIRRLENQVIISSLLLTIVYYPYIYLLFMLQRTVEYNKRGNHIIAF